MLPPCRWFKLFIGGIRQSIHNHLTVSQTNTFGISILSPNASVALLFIILNNRGRRKNILFKVSVSRHYVWTTIARACSDGLGTVAIFCHPKSAIRPTFWFLASVLNKVFGDCWHWTTLLGWSVKQNIIFQWLGVSLLLWLNILLISALFTIKF